MKTIREIIVVEGKNDTARLKRFFDCDTIETMGSQISDECLERIKAAQKARGVIVFTDPDYPGTRIRNIISKAVPDAKHAFIDKTLARTDKKVGIEHAEKEDLEESLKNCVTFVNSEPSLSWADFLDLGLTGDKARRKKVSDAFHIGVCNAKTCFRRLNQLGITKQQIEGVLS